MNRKRPSNKPRRSKPSNFGNRSNLPPPIKNKPEITRVFRFKAIENLSNVVVTRKCLLHLLFDWAPAPASIGNFWISGVHLTRVNVWGNNVSNEFTTIALEWQSRNGPSTLITDTGTSARPAHISSKVPELSMAGYWSQVADGATSLSEALFYLSAPSGSIVDVHLVLVLANGLSSATTPVEYNTVTSCTALTAGLYYNYLDVYTVAGNNLNPYLMPLSVTSTIAY